MARQDKKKRCCNFSKGIEIKTNLTLFSAATKVFSADSASSSILKYTS